MLSFWLFKKKTHFSCSEGVARAGKRSREKVEEKETGRGRRRRGKKRRMKRPKIPLTTLHDVFNSDGKGRFCERIR